jgi:rhamnosyltransferase
MQNKRIYAIIVTFNPDLVLLQEQYLSVKNQVECIIYVDNGSKNINEVKTFFEEKSTESIVFYVFNKENKGIGFAQNIGINKAKEINCTHIILFDQDSVISFDFAANLIEQEALLLSKGFKIGAIGPVYIDPVSQTYYPQIKTEGVFVKRIWPDKVTETNIKVDFIIASGSLIRISTLKNVGLMDEGLFIDTVDIEWCFRAASKGYSFFASKTTVISHSIGDKRIKSFGREISIHTPLRSYYMFRNKFIISRYNWIPLGYRCRIIFGLVLKIPIHLYDVGFHKENMKFTFRGVLDGMLNKKWAYTK